jgi:hypothetical protein
MQKERTRESGRGGQKVRKDMKSEQKKEIKTKKEEINKERKKIACDLFYESFLLISLVYKNVETDTFLRDKRKSILSMVRFWILLSDLQIK